MSRRVPRILVAMFATELGTFDLRRWKTHLSPHNAVVKISPALEKRTCGEFLDAEPSHQRRILRNRRESKFQGF